LPLDEIILQCRVCSAVSSPLYRLYDRIVNLAVLVLVAAEWRAKVFGMGSKTTRITASVPNYCSVVNKSISHLRKKILNGFM
jgi:hypothetical protein